MSETLTFVDLFAGLGGFHRALADGLGHECVFAAEIEFELQDVYRQNFKGSASYLHGDIMKSRDQVPRHDVLCGGFPCPSFSKSGKQHGRRENRGRLMRQILHIAEKRRPSFVILENVGNFERIGDGAAWHELRSGLQKLGYNVEATEHLVSGGAGLISPHHFGYPHQRDRFYVVASQQPFKQSPFPAREDPPSTLASIVQRDAPEADLSETVLTKQQVDCIEHWNEMLRSIPETEEILSPIWGDEAWEEYPYERRTPWKSTRAQLGKAVSRKRLPSGVKKAAYLASLPSYARTEEASFPDWKIRFIKDSREWFERHRQKLPEAWVSTLKAFPQSLRKLEWNCRGETRDLWTKVLQFRPSGLRAKRYNASPALVAQTSTQIPILGPERRFLTRTEALRLQGFPDNHKLPSRRGPSFAALGNAVHVQVVRRVASRALGAS